MKITPAATVLAAFLALGWASRASAQSNYSVLASFGNNVFSNEISAPLDLVSGPNGSFYATVTGLGPALEGFQPTTGLQVVRFDTAGNWTLVHDFSNDPIGAPGPLTLGIDGNLYGETSTAVIQMTPAGVVTSLHTFGSVPNDGSDPNGVLAQGADGTLYGTTQSGGSTQSGILFSITPGGAYTIIHNFNSGSPAVDGIGPIGPVVIGADGTIYTATAAGGVDGQSGTIFQQTSGGTPSLLFDFGSDASHASGTFPLILIKGSDGNLYGTASGGGANGGGTAYKLTTTGIFTVLHAFGSTNGTTDGSIPLTLLEGVDANLYGTTQQGGGITRNDNPTLDGVIFELTTSGAYSIVHSFGRTSVLFDGGKPSQYGLVETPDGLLYGVTQEGGTRIRIGEQQRSINPGKGTMFRLQVAAVQPFTPPVPAHVTASGGVGRVTVAWLASLGATSYNIYRGTTQGGEGLITYATVGALTHYNDTTAVNGTTYYYSVRSVNASGTSTTSAEVSATPSTSILHTFAAGLKMISAPGDYSNIPLADVLNIPNPRIAVWDPVNSAYDVTPTPPADTLHQGMGAWINPATPATLEVSGTDLTTYNKVFVQLHPGWNIIGDPFSIPVGVSAMLFDDQGFQSFYAQASTAPKLFIAPGIYSFGANGYTQLKGTDKLQPFAGYWIYDYKPCLLEFDR